MRIPFIHLLVGTFLCLPFPGLLAHDGEGHSRSSKLSPPEGAPSEARGSVTLGEESLTVKVKDLVVGEYAVLLDDGTGAKAEIGKIAVVDDDGDVHPSKGKDGHEGDENDELDTEGRLSLSGDQLPFGAANPQALGGRDMVVNDAGGVTVLQGKTPVAIPEEPNEKNGRCPLARPDPAVDEDAEGILKLESGGGRMVIKVHLQNLEAEKLYEVIFTKPDDSASESLGKVTINKGGNGSFKLDSKKGDAIPFGAGSIAALKDYKVSVKDEAGAVVLVGTVCEAPVKPDDDHPAPKPRCFTASLDGAQEVPLVDTTATGKAKVELGGKDGLRLEYEVSAEGLSGPAILMHIHSGAVGVPGPVLIPLDHVAMKGEIEVTAEQAAEIRSGNTYVDIHTDANPGGEIRGQLVACGRDDDEDDDDDDDHDGDHHDRCLSARLDGAQEVPVVDTEATGKAKFELEGEDGLRLEYEVESEGLSGPAIAMHIHSGAVGVPGPVLIPLDHLAMKGQIEVTAEQAAEILSGNTYINIHTDANQGGEIRGQIIACRRDNGDNDCDDDDDDHDGKGHDGDGHDGDGHHGGGGGEIVSEEPMFLMVGDFDTPFLRGDSNGDAKLDISDITKTLNYLFLGDSRPYCLDATDTNDDGAVDISDAIAEIFYLFQGGQNLSEPGTLIPGSDPTADDLYCQEAP